jgi:archaellum component FlaC
MTKKQLQELVPDVLVNTQYGKVVTTFEDVQKQTEHLRELLEYLIKDTQMLKKIYVRGCNDLLGYEHFRDVAHLRLELIYSITGKSFEEIDG